MINFSTTKMTSKGQVVIPEETRKRLGVEPGTQFMILEGTDTLIFKIIHPPSIDDFDKLLAKASRQVKKAGIKKSDVVESIRRVRARKKRK